MLALYPHGHQETTNGAHSIKTPRPAFVIYGAASISDNYSVEMEYKGECWSNGPVPAGPPFELDQSRLSNNGNPGPYLN